MKNIFKIATKEDLLEISEIEKEAFTGVIPDEELFDVDKLSELYEINPEMIYVLKNPDTLEILSFTIVSPITKECFKLFLENKIQDLVNFSKEEKEKYIKKTNNPSDYEYCYLTDICTKKGKNGKRNKMHSIELLAEIINTLLKKNTLNLVSFPITNEGKTILLTMQFKKVNDDIYGVHVNEEIKNFYYSYIDRVKNIFNKRQVRKKL